MAEDTSGENAIYLGELGSTDRRLLLHARSNVVYASGHLLYVRGRQLVAQRFDPKRLTFDGEATTVADGVRYERGFLQGVFSASETGILAFQRGEAADADAHPVVRALREARRIPDGAGPALRRELSPDGKTAAVSTGDPGDIWLYDLARGIRTRLTFDPMTDTGPVWSPDGKAIYYSSDRKIHWRIYRRQVSGAGQEETMTSRRSRHPPGTCLPTAVSSCTSGTHRRPARTWISGSFRLRAGARRPLFWRRPSPSPRPGSRRTAGGSPTHPTSRAAERYTSPRFRAARESGRSRAAGESPPAGGGTGARSSTSRPTAGSIPSRSVRARRSRPERPSLSSRRRSRGCRWPSTT